MGIMEDLEKAKAAASSLVTVKKTISDLAALARTSDKDDAHWLVLKGAHQQVPAYLLYPLGYAMEKLPLTSDKKGYQAVYDACLVSCDYMTERVWRLGAAREAMKQLYPSMRTRQWR